MEFFNRIVQELPFCIVVKSGQSGPMEGKPGSVDFVPWQEAPGRILAWITPERLNKRTSRARDPGTTARHPIRSVKPLSNCGEIRQTNYFTINSLGPKASVNYTLTSGSCW